MRPRIAYLDRADFLANYWTYNRGEHVFFTEPTQQGKSYLAHQMLGATLPRLPEGTSVLDLMPKMRDPATAYWAPRLGLKILDRWPPPGRFPGQAKPPGYVLWPKHIKGAAPAVNREHVGAMLRPALSDLYYRGNSLVFADDAHIAAVLMGLNADFEDWLTMAAGGGGGLWLAAQKPSGSKATGSLTSFAYSAPTHLIFGKDPDERNIQRLREIGGVDPRLVADTVRSLRFHQIKTPTGIKNVSEKLYIHKGGPFMAIIGPLRLQLSAVFPYSAHVRKAAPVRV